MSEYDDDLTQDGEEVEQEAAAPRADDSADMARLREQNRKLTFKVHKTELEAKYGSEIAGLVPETMPFKEWDQFAEKLIALRGTAVEEKEAEPAEAPQEEPSATEQALATASSQPSATSAGPDLYREMTAKQIGELPAGEREKAMQAKYADSV